MNLASIVAAISAVPQLLTIIGSTVQAIEATLPNMPGSTKLKAALVQVEGIVATVVSDVATLTAMKSVLTPLVNAAVATYNAIGLFKKSTPAPASTQGVTGSSLAGSTGAATLMNTAPVIPAPLG